jgi:hypothetical protein
LDRIANTMSGAEEKAAEKESIEHIAKGADEMIREGSAH